MSACSKASVCPRKGGPKIKCVELVKTSKKNQTPVIDGLGPFPDEPALCSFDHVLQLLGAHGGFNLLDDCTCGECALSVQPTPCPSNLDINLAGSSKSCNSGNKPSSILKKKCSGGKSKASIPIVDALCGSKSVKTGGCTCGRKKSQTSVCSRKAPLPRSFSLCSLACRKIKEKLGFQTNKGGSSNWLWTRMHCNKDGCEIYEIFKSSTGCKQPPKKCGKPNLIFVVLPNGVIMPFETLNTH
ncbi:uncharacterized protein LOC119689612 [Teleopsis dalmanni]|uniref:uncharacterized protein LOC119689612 n=1 Tax=Teleopsis dalmanni TaxID=139649 RepID=UPI0018CF9788|nr:uncharacterized protein LOC119689612 [Teleopsis dalmanni]